MEERKRLLVYGLLSGYLAGLLYVLTFIAQGLVMDPPDMFGMLAMMGSLMGDMLGITDKMMIVMIIDDIFIYLNDFYFLGQMDF